MFVAGTDFTCAPLHGVYICKATGAASVAYAHLQDQVRTIAGTLAQQRADVPPQLAALTVDGRIGPTTAIGTQFLLAAFNRTVPVPAALAPLLGADGGGEDVIGLVAATAAEISAYLQDVVLKHPEAFTAPVTEKIVDRLVNRISPKTTVMIFGGALLVLGTVYAVRRMEHERSGAGNKNHFLPDADGEDDDDEGA